jgi:hypothetical protein
MNRAIDALNESFSHLLSPSKNHKELERIVGEISDEQDKIFVKFEANHQFPKAVYDKIMQKINNAQNKCIDINSRDLKATLLMMK